MESWYELLNEIVNYSSSLARFREILETRKVDLDRRDGSGRTLLDYCAYLKVSEKTFTPEMLNSLSNLDLNLQKAVHLLRYGANPNLSDQRGWTIIHQCAINGDLTFLQLCVYFNADVNVHNIEGQQPIDLALLKKHTHIVRYLEIQSLSLKAQCRRIIREAMGSRTYRQINELPLPPSLKFFVNYGNPFPGSTLPVFVPCPWTEEEIVSQKVSSLQVVEFIENNASSEFIEEKKLRRREEITVGELAAMFEALYFWEAFKNIDYEEPLARKPRYSLEKVDMHKESPKEATPQTDFSNIFRRFRHRGEIMK